jgi:hypothetical protein
MRLNPSLPLSDSFQARLAAQAILRHSFNMKLAVAELRPDIKQWRSFGAKLLAEPAVQYKIEVIMNREDRNVQKYVASLWSAIELYESYIHDPSKGPPPKNVTEVAQTAMRLLARAYIREKGPADIEPKPMVVDGMEEGLVNLVGERFPVNTRKTN